jgi:hypothetical protein
MRHDPSIGIEARRPMNTLSDATRVFSYKLADEGLRISLGQIVLRTVAYPDIERVERGWAPGWQVGGMGMPFRGDEVRVRVRTKIGLPWMNLTPADPDAFVQGLRRRVEAADGGSTPQG